MDIQKAMKAAADVQKAVKAPWDVQKAMKATTEVQKAVKAALDVQKAVINVQRTMKAISDVQKAVKPETIVQPLSQRLLNKSVIILLLKPPAASIEAGGNGKSFKSPKLSMPIFSLIMIPYCAISYAISNWFLDGSLKPTSWRLGGCKALLKPQE